MWGLTGHDSALTYMGLMSHFVGISGYTPDLRCYKEENLAFGHFESADKLS